MSPHHPSSSVRSLLKAVLLLALLAPLSALAEMRTLIDQLGRSIKADVISVEAGIVKIKRADGILFDLPLKNLSDDTQAELKAWAAQNTATASAASKAAPETVVFIPTEKSITMAVNRGKFDVDIAYKSEYSQDSYEEWGYNIQLTNTTLYPIDKLRIEYNLFGRRYSGSEQSVKVGSQTVEPVGSRKTISFRTSKSFRISKWKTQDTKAYGGQLTGVWVRLYHGNTLLQEYSSPESIRTKEKWATNDD